jgi:hypothetical protein
MKAAHRAADREQAIQIAEAGIDYYRWHLAHAPQDFQDGTALPGPYVHPYFDKDGTVIGEFTLNIIPPPIGSTIVTVRSTGATTAYPQGRTIESRLAIPSIAKYATVANAEMRFGAGTEVFGPIHSNGGIRFDGLAHNVVSSAVASYDDSDHSGGNEFGVHTHLTPVDPLPPAAVPSRPDVFEVGREFPVPAVDFAGITADLAQIKTDAQVSGQYFAASGGLGYKITLRVDDTFDLYRVNSLVNPPSGCTGTQSGWGTWSIRTTGGSTTLLGNYAFPANGLVFVEDHLWVEGQIARFPDNAATRTSITVNNDITYTNYDGQDTLGLIAQNNFNVGLVSEDDLRIDAALIAQNGRAGRYYYDDDCDPGGVDYYERDILTLYGMIATNQRYGFAYTDGTGYDTRNINYDANLLYGPPPSFPLTSDQYSIISWEEIE